MRPVFADHHHSHNIQFDKARSTTALFSVRSTEVFLRLQYYQSGPLHFNSKSFSNRSFV